MIDITRLTDADKGRRVRYHACGVTEWGTIRRWNERFIFVLYVRKQLDGGQAYDRTGHTPEATAPENLEFV